MRKIILLMLLTLVLGGCTFQDVLTAITPTQPVPEQRPAISFLGTEIPEGGAFVIISNDACIANVQMRVLEVHEQTIRIEAFADANQEGVYIPRDPTSQVLIHEEKCIPAHMLCGETEYSYCFTLKSNTEPIELQSMIK